MASDGESLPALVRANVRRLRHARGLTQEDLSERSGLSRTYVSLIESRGQNLSFQALEALADALEADVRELFRPQDEWPEDGDLEA